MSLIIRIVVALSIMFALSACNRGGGNGQPLINLRGSPVAPDEFLVVPQKALETPANLTALPAPEPGSANLTEIDFEGRLFSALGGGATGSGVPASELALVQAVQSAGVTPDIREVLRQEDQEFRDSRKGRIERLTQQRKAITIYDDFLLDPYAELRRLRADGVKTPAAPPNIGG